jgi:hypothetical protein
MKKILPLLSLVIVLVCACNSNDRKLTESTEDDLNTANTFLKASLRGDYTKARTLMLQDSLNVQGIDVYERVYKNMTPDEKSSYANASIRIHETKKIDSVTTIFHYSNSYRNKVDSIRMVKVNGKWLADLMFRFRQNTDTLFNQ